MTERERVARLLREIIALSDDRDVYDDAFRGLAKDCAEEAIAAIAAIDTRADALREAAAIGRAMSLSGCTPGKIWRKLDAMSEQAQPQPADQKRDKDTGPG